MQTCEKKVVILHYSLCSQLPFKHNYIQYSIMAISYYFSTSSIVCVDVDMLFYLMHLVWTKTLLDMQIGTGL